MKGVGVLKKSRMRGTYNAFDIGGDRKQSVKSKPWVKIRVINHKT